MTKIISIKSLFSFLGILLIGALGSGLWEVFLKDFLYNMGALFVKIVSHLYSGYIDSLYKSVGNHTYSIFEIFPTLVIIIIIIFLPLWINMYWRRFSHSSSEAKPLMNKANNQIIVIYKRIRFVITFITIILSIAYTSLLIQGATNLRARNYIEITIDIVRPNIQEKEYFNLKRQFKQIHDKDTFVKTLQTISEYAKRDSTELPKARFYGVTN